MHARTRSLTLGLVVALGLLFIGCAEQNAKPAARDAITPPVPSQKIPKPDNLPEAAAPNILPRTYMAAGRFHEGQGHYARALEQYQQAAATDPKNVEAWNRLGIVLDRMGRFKEADDAFKKAIALAPEAAHLHNNLAFSYMTQARWVEAEAELYEALQLKPDFLRARVNLGMVLAQRDRFDDAMTHFEAGLTKADALFNMGLMYQSKRKLPEAARSFHLALKENPKLVAAQKRLEMLPPEAAKAGKEMATAVASPEPEKVVASVTPATRPAAETEAKPEDTARLPELAEPVHADGAMAVSDVKAEAVEIATEVSAEAPPVETASVVEGVAPVAADNTVVAAGAKPDVVEMDAPAVEATTVEAVASIDNIDYTEAADLAQDTGDFAEVTTRPESADMQETVAAEAEDEPVADTATGEHEAESTSPEREATGSTTATQPAENHVDEPAESSDTASEGTGVSDAAPGLGLVSSLLAGLSDRAETARAVATSLMARLKTVGREAIASIQTADPYAEFLRMASPLALEVRPARAGVRPFEPVAATASPGN